MKCYIFCMEAKTQKKENIIKRWYKLCKPNKKDFTMQIITYAVHAVLYALMTVFAAYTIDCIYNHDWKGAFFWLAIEFLDILLRNIVNHVAYHYYNKVYGGIRKNITSKIFDKLFVGNDLELKNFSTEKIINIAQESMNNACDFPDYVGLMFANLMQVLVAIVTIFTVSVWAGGLVIALGVVDFFIVNALNKKIGRHLKGRYEKKDDSFREYSKIIAGKSVIGELGVQEEYKKKLLSHIDGFNKEFDKYYMTFSFRENIFYAIWNFAIYIITAVLVYLISRDMFDLSMYLIIVPYLKSCTEKLNTLYTKFGGVENMRVDVDRVNLILSLSDKEMISYGNVNKAEGYNLGFVDVSYQDPNEPNLKLKNVDISFKMNAVNIIKGERGSGKRLIFDMLRRRIKPAEGIVLLDNLNLFDYNQSTFKSHIDYCAQHPIFIKGTIKENLQATKKELATIKAHIEELGLSDVIDKLPKGLDTQVEDLDSESQFWVGLIRGTLSKCKVLMLYEYPTVENPEFKAKFENIIRSCETDKRTLIIFTHDSLYDNLAELVYEVKNGKVKIANAKSSNKKVG